MTAISVTKRLDIVKVLEGLAQNEKLYAHHMARAAWSGARIVMRQVSPEAESVFDFILEVHKSCNGKWDDLLNCCGVSKHELDAFLEYAALFLGNVGNYYVSSLACVRVLEAEASWGLEARNSHRACLRSP